MNDFTKSEKVANIIAFFAIMFGEEGAIWDVIMKYNPDYIIDKFERYVLSGRVEYPWGMHPALRDNRFHHYIDKWELELKHE